MNVFLGEPSDAIISHLDKRYYKHTVDAMNVDVSACYKVCEEKEATMPAEKTSSNLSATIQSIKGGYTEGDIDVPVTGSITGVDSEGYSVRGDVCGSICGNVGTHDNYCGICGTVYGDVGGGVCGDVYCGVSGSIKGQVYGIVYGDILCGVYGTVHCGVGGNIIGDVSYGIDGNICGGVNGNINYDVCGYVGGTVYGGVCGSVGAVGGSVYTDVCGDVGGSVYGSIGGDVYGAVRGWIKTSGIPDSSVLTLDKIADENTLLKIDVSGTQYFIHVN